jgi:hypothetical protein
MKPLYEAFVEDTIESRDTASTEPPAFDDFGSRYGKSAELVWATVDSNHLPPR